ncbi:hypothetical protein H8S90_04005 [Olivibacter sp. SDN3]|uniref:hypothetical protein n=1 Tax=Olivibacter sp. SDN3 TaxID=2764720 RepID=UPI001650F1E2|nr:hypothetical protein [Olivibacter sp. SDN3]QNL50768.1 hypothetical protein H8S90_04005 [Olivibacter sp. SDN3]
MKATTALILLTIYLLIHVILGQIGTSPILIYFVFFTSPFLIIWTVLIILKDKRKNYPELSENQEWGYADRDDLTTDP